MIRRKKDGIQRIRVTLNISKSSWVKFQACAENRKKSASEFTELLMEAIIMHDIMNNNDIT